MSLVRGSSGKNDELRFFVHGEIVLTIDHPTDYVFEDENGNVKVDFQKIKDGLLNNSFINSEESYEERLFVNHLVDSGFGQLATNCNELLNCKTVTDLKGIRGVLVDSIKSISSRSLIQPLTLPNEGANEVISQLTLDVNLGSRALDDIFVIYSSLEIMLNVRPEIISTSLHEIDPLEAGILNGQGDVQILNASPNWYFSSSQGGGLTTGGPGTEPVPEDNPKPWEPDFEFPTIAPPASRPLDESKIRGKPEKQTSSDQNDGAHVIILDTIPSETQIETAVEKFTWNPLLQEMANAADVTSHYYENSWQDPAFIVPTLEDDQTKIVSHTYNMSDHGLFVAGLVRMLNPAGKIDLVEVLNQNGVGTLTSLKWGLAKAGSLVKEDEKTIINCSLTISFQNSEAFKQFVIDYFEVLDRPIPEELNVLLSFIGTVFESAMLFDLLFSFALAKLKSRFILAAAGNDSKLHEADTDVEPTRFPAGLPNVTGVGALDSESEIAPYSNEADELDGRGFWTYGGDVFVNSEGHMFSAPNSLMSLYTSCSFPNGQPNRHGWARWSGTSFASGVVAGMMSRLIQNGLPADSVKQYLTDIEAEVAEEPRQKIDINQQT